MQEKYGLDWRNSVSFILGRREQCTKQQKRRHEDINRRTEGESVKYGVSLGYMKISQPISERSS